MALILLVTGAVAGYSLSIASAQGEDSTIYACVNKWNGTTRIVDENDDCGRSEYAESWAEQGPRGPIGASGPAGKDGKDGKDGAQGPPGKDGARGPAGKDGQDGKDGKDGAPAGFSINSNQRQIGAKMTLSYPIACPDDMFAINGGVEFNPELYPGLELSASFEQRATANTPLPYGWWNIVINRDTEPAEYMEWVVCASR